MKSQPKPSHQPLPTRMPGADADPGAAVPRPARVPAIGPRLLSTWPVEFEVEPWRP